MKTVIVAALGLALAAAPALARGHSYGSHSHSSYHSRSSFGSHRSSGYHDVFAKVVHQNRDGREIIIRPHNPNGYLHFRAKDR